MLYESSYIYTVLVFYNDLSLFYRNQGISSSLPTLVTAMSTLFCQPKNYMEHLQILASVSRYHCFLSSTVTRIVAIKQKCQNCTKGAEVEYWFPACWILFLSPCNISLQSTKCSSARDLKLLCADDEQTRTCWITAMRLLKVGLLITNSGWCLRGGMLSQC